MTDKQKIKILKKCFEDTIWMAIRYADGRKTYAPGMVRDAVSEFKNVFPEFELRKDIVIKKPEKIYPGWGDGDYLYDLF